MHGSEKNLLLLEPQAIDCSGPWLFWGGEPDRAFLESLGREGQIEPVLVVRQDGRNLLVAGSRRVMGLARLNLPVRAVLADPTGPAQLGIAYLLSNWGRAVDDGMRVRALRFFCAIDVEPEGYDRVLTLLGVEPRSRQARFLGEWLTLPKDWDQLLEVENIPLAAASYLCCMGSEERDAVFPFFKGVKWSRGNALHFLTWLTEIGKRDQVPVDAVVDNLALKTHLVPELSPKDTIFRLLKGVRKSRFSQLSRLEDNFQHASRQVLAQTGWTVLQPDNFETERVEFRLTVSHRDGLEEAVKKLERFVESGGADPLFKDQST
ncbi:MAG: hypothetical protein ACLFTB_09175 [Desulfovibrionales bacterium]